MWRYAAILAAGIAIGLGTAAASISQFGSGSGVRVGPWQTPIDAGGPGRSPYLRAAAALRATLALSRQEAIYFRAATDSQGQTLLGTCTYVVHGPDLPARWWSITLYGTDHYLIANPGGRYAIASVDAARAPDGGFTIAVSPHAKVGNWLDSASASGIVLLARLYQPSAQAASAPANIALPRIDRQACT